MRLKLTLRHAPHSILPKDYEYLISSWIYNTLWQANTEFATWLHNGTEISKDTVLSLAGPKLLLAPEWD